MSWKLASIISKTVRDKGTAREKKANYYKLDGKISVLCDRCVCVDLKSLSVDVLC